jgi:hypothetical protein
MPHIRMMEPIKLQQYVMQTMARRSPRLRTRHYARHVYGGTLSLKRYRDILGLPNSPWPRGAGSSRALNTPDHFNARAQGGSYGAHRPLNRQHTRPATPHLSTSSKPPLTSGSTGCDHYTGHGTNRLLTDHPIPSAP